MTNPTDINYESPKVSEYKEKLEQTNREVIELFRQASHKAASKIIDLIDDDDGSVSLKACEKALKYVGLDKDDGPKVQVFTVSETQAKNILESVQLCDKQEI